MEQTMNDFPRCERCGEPLKTVVTLPVSPVFGGERRMVVSVLCKCGREQEERRKREAQAAADMERVNRLREASLMGAHFRDATFDSFTEKRQNARNLKICRRYVEKFDQMVENNQGLLLYGEVGTGKTFAAACIANTLLAKRVSVMMTSLVSLIGLISSGEEKESSVLNSLSKAKLVIFDDLGAERNTSYGVERIYSIIDGRYRQRLPTIFTTNLTMDDLKDRSDVRYGRIYDRIIETCYPMQFTGVSWRLKDAKRRYDEMERILNEDLP